MAEENQVQESQAEASQEAAVEVPAKFKKLVEEVENMSVLELSELVKVLEKKFGVSASAVAVAGPAAGGAAAEEGKSTADVELTDAGGNKIAVIKVVKEVLALGLKEAKDLVDAAPSMVKTGLKKEEAEELKKKLEDAGAKVTLK
jgi:large subunit ribosomal protein L7/L12